MVATNLCVGQVALSPVQATAFPSMRNNEFPLITLPPPVVGQPMVIYGVAKLLFLVILMNCVNDNKEKYTDLSIFM
ncbi:Uncharacterised protein [Acinetobacter baumannii]|nr:Uncharacterised protein [Acinetobacter baumannii]